MDQITGFHCISIVLAQDLTPAGTLLKKLKVLEIRIGPKSFPRPHLATQAKIRD